MFLFLLYDWVSSNRNQGTFPAGLCQEFPLPVSRRLGLPPQGLPSLLTHLILLSLPFNFLSPVAASNWTNPAASDKDGEPLRVSRQCSTRSLRAPPDNVSCYSYLFAYFIEFFLVFCDLCWERQFSILLTQALGLAIWQETATEVGRFCGTPITLP